MKLVIGLCVVLIGLSGCASHLIVRDAKGAKQEGVPVNSARLFRIMTTTSYTVRPEYSTKPEKELCSINQTTYSYKPLPLGERFYIGFDPANFGKSEFSVNFSDTGILTSVTLNSDPTETIKKTTDLLTSALPYIASPKPVPPAAAARGEKPVITADKDRALYCLTKEVKEEIILPKS